MPVRSVRVPEGVAWASTAVESGGACCRAAAMPVESDRPTTSEVNIVACATIAHDQRAISARRTSAASIDTIAMWLHVSLICNVGSCISTAFAMVLL